MSLALVLRLARGAPVASRSAANVTLLMVVALSLFAGLLGPRVSGLLAPFPIIGSVMAAFTHITHRRDALHGYSVALLKGLPSFALFAATVAVSVGPLGTLNAFTLASVVTAVSHGVLTFLDTRSQQQLDTLDQGGLT